MKMLSIVAAALAFAGFAGAAEVLAAKPATPPASQAEQEGSPVGTQLQTSGKVVSVHSVPMVGASDPHMVVKIETEQGDTDIVDLGSAAELKSNEIEPKEGQKLWIDGRVGKINDKFLIVAEQISETKMVTVVRTTPLREESVKHAEARNDGKEVKEAKAPSEPKTETVDAGQQVRTVEGTVLHTRHVKVEGEAVEHALAKIQTENGIAVIDLGSYTALPANVNIADGQSLAATGFVGQLNGKPIILADSIGNLCPVQRSNSAAPLPVPAK